MHQTAVLNVVGLSKSLIGDATPNISAFLNKGNLKRLNPVLPAVTCSVQSSMLTGVLPNEHGIVGNGWFNREQQEVQFWKQSNKLVQAEKIWETARQRDSTFTCANMFWWYNMYSTVDWSVTPRPIYKADGRKIPDIYTNPADLRDTLQLELGRFPLFNFWGPMSNIKSSKWIADASKLVYELQNPVLMLIYLPHLDYSLQKLGPNHPDINKEVNAIDKVVGDLINFFANRNSRIILLSEYGIEPVSDAIHINRALRKEGLLTIREEDGLELLDSGASDAFAVADHQVAHVYVSNPEKVTHIAEICKSIEGVEKVLTKDEQRAVGIDHERSGEIVLISSPGRWFSYYYWLDDSRAPDFARTVDIHNKPGYDPAELFMNPGIPLRKLSVAWKLLKRKLGFRTLLDVIPLDASLVRGSHGRINVQNEHSPVLITRDPTDGSDTLPCTAVRDVILNHIFD